MTMPTIPSANAGAAPTLRAIDFGGHVPSAPEPARERSPERALYDALLAAQRTAEAALAAYERLFGGPAA